MREKTSKSPPIRITCTRCVQQAAREADVGRVTHTRKFSTLTDKRVLVILCTYFIYLPNFFSIESIPALLFEEGGWVVAISEYVIPPVCPSVRPSIPPSLAPSPAASAHRSKPGDYPFFLLIFPNRRTDGRTDEGRWSAKTKGEVGPSLDSSFPSSLQ